MGTNMGEVAVWAWVGAIGGLIFTVITCIYSLWKWSYYKEAVGEDSSGNVYYQYRFAGCSIIVLFVFLGCFFVIGGGLAGLGLARMFGVTQSTKSADQPGLKGTWKLVTAKYGGAEMTGRAFQGIEFIYDGAGKGSVWKDKRLIFSGTISFHPKKIRSFEGHFTSKISGASSTCFGTYELDGKTLKVWFRRKEAKDKSTGSSRSLHYDFELSRQTKN